MACDTCDHTLHRVNDGEPRVWWCPRCGTIKTEGRVPEFVEPKIVNRAFRLCEATADYVVGECSQERMEHEQAALRECCENPTLE